MKNERQVKQQMASWITKNRWAPLLTWFNQNDTTLENWKNLLGQANLYDVQAKWPHYIEFFQQHLDNKTHKNMPLVQYSGAQESAWKLLNVAMPLFFGPLFPSLAVEQQMELRAKAMEWFAPWLPKINESQSIHNRDAMVTVFRTLIAMDARSEWSSVEHLVHKDYVPRLVQHTLGKDIAWADGLRDLHLGHGHSIESWRVALLRVDCVEHLLAEKIAMPVAKAFLDYAIQEQRSRNSKTEDALAMVFRRHPHLRVWTERSGGSDAQVCRAMLDIAEPSPGTEAKTIQIAKSLGLPMAEWASFLETSTVVATIDVDGAVFDDSSLGA